MPTTQINFARHINQLRDENIRHIMYTIDTPETMERIEQFSQRSGLSTDYIFNLLNGSEQKDLQKYIAAQIAINPIKQSSFERISLQWIRRRLPMINMVKSPGAGPDALRFHDHKIVPTALITTPTTRCRSMDFTGTLPVAGAPTLQLYVYHKYSRQQGGSQDNNFEDMVHFIHEANNANMIHTHFFAIVDGDYYHTPLKRRRCTRADSLRSMVRSKRVHVLRTSDMPDLITHIMQQHANRYNRSSSPCSPTSKSPLTSSTRCTPSKRRQATSEFKRSAS